MHTQTDVLVIGAGAAGLTAALAAHEQGAAVSIIEKNARLGGTASISGGIVWTPNNAQMRAAGLEDSTEDGLAYFQSLNHGDIDESLIRAFVEHGPEALSFLEGLGALRLSLLKGYPDYYLDRPGAKPGGGRALDNELLSFQELGAWADKVYSVAEPPRLMLRETPLGGASGIIEPEELQRRLGADERGWGQALIGRLLKACLSRGLEPSLETSAVKLLTDNGTVVGAEVEREGERTTITARRGVILSTGGFEWNEELRQAFLRGPMDAPASPPTNYGDGLKIAMAVGAELGNMTSSWWVPTVSIPGDVWSDGSQRSLPVLIERTLPHTILVNRRGERFCNEANNYNALGGVFHAMNPDTYDYDNIPAYLIFDNQYRSRYPLASLMPGMETPNWVARADTLRALGDVIGVDGEALESTVARFNQGAERAEDPDFGRGRSLYDRFYGDRSRPDAAATLGPLSEAPFHAVEIRMGTLGTNGGPKTDAAARVQHVDGGPIPGLFAAGNVMAGPTGGVYAGAGGTLGPTLTFGVIAGREAARRNQR